MTEVEKLKKKLKKISKKPKIKTYIPRVDKKRKKRIIHNPKEFSEKYLYL